MDSTLPSGLTLDTTYMVPGSEQFQAALALAPAALAASSPVSAVLLAVGGVFVVVLTAYIALKRGLDSTAHRTRHLSPEKITGHRAAFSEEEMVRSAELLAGSITERATEMHRALEEDRSEVRLEMCAIGYRKCANDMITLTHLVNEELKGAGFARRWRLVRVRKRAVEALSKVRGKLPADALKSARHEKQ